jgi:hypothetical protein
VILLLLALAQAAPADPPAGDDIVVVAAKRKCRVRFADRDMSDDELRSRQAEWAAGKPVRIIARQSTDIKCLAKIAFKLADNGVRLIELVEPQGAVPPASPVVRQP